MDSRLTVLTSIPQNSDDVEARSRLREIREERGLSRRQIAEQLGVSIAAVQDYERSEAAGKITLTTLKKYAVVLGCEVTITITPRDRAGAADANTVEPDPLRTPPKVEAVPEGAPLIEPGPQLHDRMGLWSAPVND